MSASVPNSFTANTKIQSAQVNANFTAVLALTPITTLGDLVYASSSTAMSRLAGNTTTTKKFLTQTGDGANSAAPAWGTVVESDVLPTQSSNAGKYLQTNGTSTSWAAAPSGSKELTNLGLTTSVASNALTIALKQSDGSTDPSTGASAVKIGFRSSTSTSGAYNQRSVTSSLSLVVSSGSTLGHSNSVATYFYVYAIDNSGTVELAVSSKLFDDGSIVSTTAEGGAGAADSATIMYSTTARSNVPCRLIGRLLSTQTTAGTWAAAMTEVSVSPFFPQDQVGSNGALVAPAGYIGEYMEAVQSSATNVGTSDQYIDLNASSLTLTPGDWDVSIVAKFDRNSATWTGCRLGIGTTTGNSSAGLVFGENAVMFYAQTSGNMADQAFLSVPPYRIRVTSNTTYYGKVLATYSAGNPQYQGRISARRVR